MSDIEATVGTPPAEQSEQVRPQVSGGLSVHDGLSVHEQPVRDEQPVHDQPVRDEQLVHTEQHEDEPVLDLPDPPQTGDPEVDEAISAVARAAGGALEDQLVAYDAAHRTLQDRLADVEG